MKFIVLNSFVALLLFAAWYIGLFTACSLLSTYEYIMLAALTCYSLIGFGSAFLKRWSIVEHIANAVPMYALAMTGLGMTLVIAQMGSVTSSSLVSVLKSITLAIFPNILGVMLMAWLNEIMFWCKK